MGTYLNNTLEGNLQTVAQLAISHPGALAVFTKYNIDYCCGGNRSLEDACRRIGLAPEKIKAEIIQQSQGEINDAVHPQHWRSSFLADYIIENHHHYVKRAIPEIQAFLDKVCDAHGNDCLALLQIREHFLDLSEDLTSHMKKEELVLFPAIKRLEAQQHLDHPLADSIQAPIEAMEHDHVAAGELIKQIRTLSNNYTPPDFACPTFKITYQKLHEFDNDLMKHVHLENNILFARYKEKATLGGSCSL
ncbi:iron-sulfur cluster repair di-iron protein [Pseudochryseolinea flava]|uniref:Iron-sulfur cluster repair di-iron protein n=1 Tax=Pseudochryseolinea flava TaxID=2059302 RepID=A0A364Y6I9_9BACT|nr:iron-sulfur cluster repair di-iron protein [Pseudochryseolinea flava]RAW02550.1 iron-sulfur cluster repair di-iron protein [Pseudochryseolinea flava]